VPIMVYGRTLNNSYYWIAGKIKLAHKKKKKYFTLTHWQGHHLIA
jgi:hypothetical protein